MWADDNGQAFSTDVAGVNSGSRDSLLDVDYGRNTQVFAGWYLRGKH
jgi:hypothetical protein